MEFEKVLEELKEAHSHLDTFVRQENKIIEIEVKFLIEFAKKVFPFATKKEINGDDALLVYVFSNDKTIISSEVYLTKRGEITYQIYDDKSYLGYRPDAMLEGGFVKIPAAEFLKTVSLPEIIEFFADRIEILYQDAEEKNKRNKEREQFLHEMKEFIFKK